MSLKPIELICKTVTFDRLECKNPIEAYGTTVVVALAAIAAAYKVYSSERVTKWLGRDIVTRAGKGELDNVRAMLRSNSTSSEELSNALMTAIEKGHTTIFRELIQSNKVPVPNGALHCALRNRRVNMIPVLIEECDCNLHDRNGNTPLMVAAEKGDQRATQLLLEKEVEVDEQNNDGKTALHFASREYPAIVGLLLKKDANANIPDSEGQLPLHYAVDQDTKDSVAALLLQTDDPNHQDNEGNTPLHLTANHRGARLKVVDKLLEDTRLKCDLHNKEGELALTNACSMPDGKDELALKMIRSNRFDLNAFTKEKSPLTAAHVAMDLKEKGKAILEALGKAGADFTVGKKGVSSVLAHGFESKSEAALAHLISMQEAKTLMNFKHRGLNIAQWGVVLGSYQVRKALHEKGIYFEGKKKEEIAKEIVKIHISNQDKFFDVCPVKIKEIEALREDIKEDRKVECCKEPYLMTRLIRMIQQYLQNCEENDQFRKNGKAIEIFAGFSEVALWNMSLGPVTSFLPDRVAQRLSIQEPPPELIKELNRLPPTEISLNDLDRYAPMIKQYLNQIIPFTFS